MLATVEILGLKIESAVALWSGGVGLVFILAGMVAVTPFRRFVDEQKLRQDEDLVGIAVADDVPGRVLTPVGKVVRKIGIALLVSGFALNLAAYLYEKS